MPGNEHVSVHANEQERVDMSRGNIERAREAARRWHSSEAGLAYHSVLGKENWKKRTVQTYVCNFCGREFQTKHIYGEGMNHFCHQNCKQKYRTRRLRNENQEH